MPYSFPDDMLDNGEVNPENKCFCASGKCLPTGASDASQCYLGKLMNFITETSSKRRKWIIDYAVIIINKNIIVLNTLYLH